MKGSQTRLWCESISLKYADNNCTLKVSPSLGQVNASIKGLAEPALLELKDRIESGSDRALAVSNDAGKLESVACLFAKIGQKFGRLDLLSSNAGVSGVGTLFENITFDHQQNIVNINLKGSFLCAQNTFRMLKNKQPLGRRIINNGSI